jgi:hypothetical protein
VDVVIDDGPRHAQELCDLCVRPAEGVHEQHAQALVVVQAGEVLEQIVERWVVMGEIAESARETWSVAASACTDVTLTGQPGTGTRAGSPSERVDPGLPRRTPRPRSRRRCRPQRPTSPRALAAAATGSVRSGRRTPAGARAVVRRPSPSKTLEDPRTSHPGSKNEHGAFSRRWTGLGRHQGAPRIGRCSRRPGTCVRESGHERAALEIGGRTIDATRLEDICDRYGIAELAVFGSVARGDASWSPARWCNWGVSPGLSLSLSSILSGGDCQWRLLERGDVFSELGDRLF